MGPQGPSSSKLLPQAVPPTSVCNNRPTTYSTTYFKIIRDKTHKMQNHTLSNVPFMYNSIPAETKMLEIHFPNSFFYHNLISKCLLIITFKLLQNSCEHPGRSQFWTAFQINILEKSFSLITILQLTNSLASFQFV